jgi:hypothetical protein
LPLIDPLHFSLRRPLALVLGQQEENERQRDKTLMPTSVNSRNSDCEKPSTASQCADVIAASNTSKNRFREKQ